MTPKPRNNNPVYNIELSDKDVKAGSKNMDLTLEEALDITGFGCYNCILFLVLTLVMTSMILEVFGTSFLLTASSCDLHLDTSTKGLIGALPMAGIIASSHFWGYIADTRGRKLTLVASLVGTCVCALVASIARHWVFLAVFKFFSAFFASASNSVVYALLGECTPRASRDKVVLLMSTGLMFGQGFLTIFAYPTLSLEFNYEIPWLGIMYKPWRLLQQLNGACSAVAAVLVIILVRESPKFFISQDREKDALRVLAEMYALNKRRCSQDYPVKNLMATEMTIKDSKRSFLKSLWEQTAPLFRPPLLKNTLVISYLVIIIYAIPPCFMMWMPSIATDFSKALASGTTKSFTFCQILNKKYESINTTSALSELECDDKVSDQTYEVLLAFSGSLSILNIINSYLLRWVSKKSVVIAYHLLAGVCGLALGSITSAFCIAVFFLAQINLVCMGFLTAVTVEVYPTYLRAMAVCLSMMVGRGASILTIKYLGQMLQTHCEELFYWIGAIVLSGAAVALLLPSGINESKKVNNETGTTDLNVTD